MPLDARAAAAYARESASRIHGLFTEGRSIAAAFAFFGDDGPAGGWTREAVV